MRNIPWSKGICEEKQKSMPTLNKKTNVRGN
jgi:hypothetical protein